MEPTGNEETSLGPLACSRAREPSLRTSGGKCACLSKMTDQDCVYQFCEIVGGHVYGPYNYLYKDGIVRNPWWLWHSKWSTLRKSSESFGRGSRRGAVLVPWP